MSVRGRLKRLFPVVVAAGTLAVVGGNVILVWVLPLAAPGMGTPLMVMTVLLLVICIALAMFDPEIGRLRRQLKRRHD